MCLVLLHLLHSDVLTESDLLVEMRIREAQIPTPGMNQIADGPSPKTNDCQVDC